MQNEEQVAVGDLNLAKMIEKEAADDDAAYAVAMKKLFPSERYSVFEFSGGSSLYLGKSPFSTTHGFGTDKKVHNESLLNEIEEFFARHGFPSSLS